jgi:hypothetical protein
VEEREILTQRRREKIIDFGFWVLDLREFNAETQGD